MHVFRRSSLLLVLLLMVACAGTSGVKRYVLTVAPADVAAVSTRGPQGGENVVVGITKITLPAYLERQPIVHRKGSKVILDDYQLWAEPLTAAVPRTLVDNLSRALPDAEIIQQPWTRESKPEWKVYVKIFRFEAVDDRAVELDARWGIIDKQGKSVMNRRLSFEEKIADGKFAGTDLSDVVVAHGKVLAALTEAISKDVGTVLAR